MKRFSVLGCVALAVVSVGCSQGDGGGIEETSRATSQALVPVTEENQPLFCSDCFSETANGGGGGGGGGLNQGGPGTAGERGANGFVGGVAGWASGAVSRVKPKGGCPPVPDPSVDCVEVHGDARPLDDSILRVTIVGRDKNNRVDVDLPRGTAAPKTIDPPCESRMATVMCVDMLKACYAAVESRDAWAKFMELIKEVAPQLSGPLWPGWLGNKQFRRNLCDRFFGT